MGSREQAKFMVKSTPLNPHRLNAVPPPPDSFLISH
jgi:hypothetical protein